MHVSSCRLLKTTTVYSKALEKDERDFPKLLRKFPSPLWRAASQRAVEGARQRDRTVSSAVGWWRASRRSGWATVIAFPRRGQGPAKTCLGQQVSEPQSWVERGGGAATLGLRHDGVFGCGRPAPGGFPVPLWLIRNCFRLQEEMLQREEAESTLQSFRQVGRFRYHPKPPDATRPQNPRAILKVP